MSHSAAAPAATSAAVPLSCLKKGEQARIDTIVANVAFGELDAQVTRRLADLGFSQGMAVTVVSAGLLGRGPFAVQLGNLAQFALREPEARKILCCPLA